MSDDTLKMADVVERDRRLRGMAERAPGWKYLRREDREAVAWLLERVEVLNQARAKEAEATRQAVVEEITAMRWPVSLTGLRDPAIAAGFELATSLVLNLVVAELKGEKVEVQKILTAIGRRAAELSVKHRPRIRKEFPRGNGGRPK